MLKILHIIPRFITGGAETLVLRYAKDFDASQFDIYIASAVEDGELRAQFPDQNKLFIGSRQKMHGRLGVWLELQKYINKLKPDLIHSHLNSSDFLVYLLRKRFKFKWVCTLHNVEHKTAWWRRRIWKTILPHADKIICVSDRVNKFSVQEFRLDPAKVITIKNGIGICHSEPAEESLLLHSTKNDSTFPQSIVKIATIGRIEEQKGHIYLLQALAQLPLQFEWEWHIFGVGSREQSLRNMAHKLGVSHKLKWRGVVENWQAEMGGFNAIIQPSLWEGLSLVIMEAMATGCPVVASEIAGEELIQHNQTGYIVKTGDVNSLFEALKFFKANPGQAMKLGQNAQLYAQRNFDIKNNISAVSKVYLSLI